MKAIKVTTEYLDNGSVTTQEFEDGSVEIRKSLKGPETSEFSVVLNWLTDVITDEYTVQSATITNYSEEKDIYSNITLVKKSEKQDDG